MSYNRGSGFEYNCSDFSQLDQLVQLKVFSPMELAPHTRMYTPAAAETFVLVHFKYSLVKRPPLQR